MTSFNRLLLTIPNDSCHGFILCLWNDFVDCFFLLVRTVERLHAIAKLSRNYLSHSFNLMTLKEILFSFALLLHIRNYT